jgi:hypothetical protein
MLILGELERIQEAAAMAYFKVQSQYQPRGTEKNQINLSQHSKHPGQDLNWVLPK